MYKINASWESWPEMQKKMVMADSDRDDTLALIEIPLEHKVLTHKMGTNTLLTAGG